MRYTAYIGLGSNLDSSAGSPAETVTAAIAALDALGSVEKPSSLYRTTPIGFIDQPDFINAAARLETDLDPEPLLQSLLAIERRFGRERRHGAPKGPRTLDLDLLLMLTAKGEPVVTKIPGLVLPHPEIARRRFVLEPLAEIAPENAPDLRHPTLGKTVRDLLADLLAQGTVSGEEVIRIQTQSDRRA